MQYCYKMRHILFLWCGKYILDLRPQFRCNVKWTWQKIDGEVDEDKYSWSKCNIAVIGNFQKGTERPCTFNMVFSNRIHVLEYKYVHCFIPLGLSCNFECTLWNIPNACTFFDTQILLKFSYVCAFNMSIQAIKYAS